MVDPGKGRRYLEQVGRVLKKHKYRTPDLAPQPLNKHTFRKNAAAGGPPRDEWWQVAEKPLPELILPKEPKPETKAREEETTGVPPTPPPRQSNLPGRILKFAATIFFLLVAYRVSPILFIILAVLFYLFRRR